MSSPSLRARIFLQVLKKAQFGTINLKLPNAEVHVFGHGLPHINLELNDWECIDLLFEHGDLGLAECIIEGRIVVDDAAKLIEWACRNDQALGHAIHGTWYGNFLSRLKHFLNRNSKTQAKANIHAHYDLGNEFFKLWLDPSMTYSSAIFSDKDESLQTAQMRKYDRIIEELNIKSGDRILEIGCGWGGFFSRAIEKTDCQVTAILNSEKQFQYSHELSQDLKFGKNLKVHQKDYREVEGRFDKIVSIEMIEAVGEKYWPNYFGKIRSSLNEKGTALIQGITIREDLFYSYSKNTDFIQQYIFPGGMLITNQSVKSQAQKQEMQLTNLFEFGLSYAETLSQWRRNFRKAIPQIKAMGFTDQFIRLWDLYLSYCEGAFRAGRINVGQFSLARI